MQITMRYQYVPIRMTKIKNTITSAEDAEQLQLSYIVAGMQNGTATQENNLVIS